MPVMVDLHWWRRTRICTRIRIPNAMDMLYHVEYVHIAQTRTWIATPYFCKAQESESDSEPDVNQPLDRWRLKQDAS